MITKYVYPAAFKLLDENKADIKAAVIKLIQALHKLVGPSFLDAIPPTKIDRVLEILKAA